MNTDILNLIKANYLKNPERVSISERNQRITYRQLWLASNNFAHELKKIGIKKDDIIAVIGTRSISTVLCFVTALKLGAIYLPIDEKLPYKRISQMLFDSMPALVIQKNPPAEITEKFVTKDALAIKLAFTELDNCAELDEIYDRKAAYLIYTSGSTGVPKGVFVPQSGLFGLCDYFVNSLHITEEDIIGQFFSISFDGSIWDITMALFCGGELCIIDDDIIEDYQAFASYVNEKGITILTLPPPYVEYLDSNTLIRLRMLITAGSSASLSLIKKWSLKFDYVNAYGLTETTICATSWIIPKGTFSKDYVSIGTAMGCHQVSIVDENGKESPLGMPGEIYVKGPGIAIGFSDNSGGFKTGDIGKQLDDGTIIFIGRNDSQVNIRGYRIELEEINRKLLAIRNVKEAVVCIKEDSDGIGHICAYYISQDKKLTQNDIINELKQILPAYMLPDWLIEIQKMPLSNSGKIDTKQLDNPYIFKADVEADYSSKIEKELADQWKVLLNIEQVNPTDNFHLLGGQSLKSIKLRNWINEKYIIKISVAMLYKNPVLKDMAAQIEQMLQGEII
ncbi:MAG: non-ribosomal peptide synthetase [Lachnospiraceae bacterium]|nr:non-ribosomal peptide synthetase [Lachnospiraceae bacterium]